MLLLSIKLEAGGSKLAQQSCQQLGLGDGLGLACRAAGNRLVVHTASCCCCFTVTLYKPSC
jgi:hypothetical protein